MLLLLIFEEILFYCVCKPKKLAPSLKKWCYTNRFDSVWYNYVHFFGEICVRMIDWRSLRS